MLGRRHRGCHDHYGCTDYKVRKGQITAVGLAASSQEQAFIYLRVVPQVPRYRSVLVIWSLKVGRESASGAIRRHFGAEIGSAANACDKWACKSWKSGEQLVHTLQVVWCLEGIIKRHTYRMQEIRVRTNDVRWNCSSFLLCRHRSNRSRQGW